MMKEILIQTVNEQRLQEELDHVICITNDLLMSCYQVLKKNKEEQQEKFGYDWLMGHIEEYMRTGDVPYINSGWSELDKERKFGWKRRIIF